MVVNPLLAEGHVAKVTAAAGTAIQRGRQLLQWWNAGPRPQFVDLEPRSPPGVRMQAFFSTLALEGATMSVMGCLQTSSFVPKPTAPVRPPGSLRQQVLSSFIEASHWTNRDGELGGFLYRPLLVKDSGHDNALAVRLVAPDHPVKISKVGSRYEWALLRLDVLDYARAFRTMGRYQRFFKRFIHEAGYLVFHPVFFESPHPAPAGGALEVCFGYAVVPWVVVPTFLAYGPGRFYAAFKQYRFFLLEDGSVTIEVALVVAPRTERVLNIFGRDPIYGTVNFLDALTFRRTRIQQIAHKWIDLYGLGHHARVHRDFLYGMRGIWEGANWQRAPA